MDALPPLERLLKERQEYQREIRHMQAQLNYKDDRIAERDAVIERLAAENAALVLALASGVKRRRAVA